MMMNNGAGSKNDKRYSPSSTSDRVIILPTGGRKIWLYAIELHILSLSRIIIISITPVERRF
jgi:hypothetical protein